MTSDLNEGPTTTLSRTYRLPRDRAAFAVDAHAQDWALAFWNVRERVFRALDSGQEFASAREALEFCMDVMTSEVEEHGLSLEDACG